MDCFYHPGVSAVGLCKSCSRGVCRDCAIEYPRGLACRDRCEADTQAVIELFQANLKLTKMATANAAGQRVAMMMIGGFISLFGLFLVWVSWQGEHPVRVLLIPGALFAGYGLFMIPRAFRFRVRP